MTSADIVVEEGGVDRYQSPLSDLVGGVVVVRSLVVRLYRSRSRACPRSGTRPRLRSGLRSVGRLGLRGWRPVGWLGLGRGRPVCRLGLWGGLGCPVCGLWLRRSSVGWLGLKSWSRGGLRLRRWSVGLLGCRCCPGGRSRCRSFGSNVTFCLEAVFTSGVLDYPLPAGLVHVSVRSLDGTVWQPCLFSKALTVITPASVVAKLVVSG